MTAIKVVVCVVLLLGSVMPMLPQSSVAAANVIVPTLINFSGTLTDINGKPLTGVAGVTFYLYKDQDGGAPLWMETHNVYPDKNGRYGVMLGSTTSTGLPSDIFVAGEARWLGVQAQGQAEQARVMLFSVPYALKAADAETIGGLPPSAFVLAAPPSPSSNSIGAAPSTGSSATGSVNGTGATDFLPLWTNSTTLGNSVLFQSGTGSTAKVGINTTTPASTLDVKGGETVRGTLSLPAIGTATASKGSNSEPVNQIASAFSGSTSKAVTQAFQWQAEPAGNDTATPSATLNLLFGAGAAAPAETGLNIASNGRITFASGQTFPGSGTITGVTAGSGLTGGGTSGTVNLSLLTSCAANQVLQWNGSAWACSNAGTGTITGVTAGTALTGGGSSGNVTLNLDTTKVAQLNAANTFTAGQTINGNLSATNLTATSVVSGQLGSFTGSNAGNILIVQNQNASGGIGVVGDSSGSGGIGMEGNAFGSSGTGIQGSGFTGVLGLSSAANGAGVIGEATGSANIGVNGVGPAAGVGVFGSSGGAFPFAPKGIGVVGESIPANGIGVSGLAFGTNGTGVNGTSQSGTGIVGLSATVTGILGTSVSSSKTETGLAGCCAVGIWGDTGSSASGAAGLMGTADDAQALVLLNNSTSHPTANINNLETTAHNVQIMNVQGAFGSCNADTDGNLTCTGRVKSNSVAAVVSFATNVDASSSDCLGALLSASTACDTPGLSLTGTTGGSLPVLIIANINGINVDPSGCVAANFALVMDGQIVTVSNYRPSGDTFQSSLTMVSMQFPAPGSHTFEVQESDDTGHCSGNTVRTNVGWPSAPDDSNFSTRTLIVREF